MRVKWNRMSTFRLCFLFFFLAQKILKDNWKLILKAAYSFFFFFFIIECSKTSRFFQRSPQILRCFANTASSEFHNPRIVGRQHLSFSRSSRISCARTSRSTNPGCPCVCVHQFFSHRAGKKRRPGLTTTGYITRS